jgi:hypothetical protein
MSKHLTIIGIICFLMIGAFSIYAEKSTELYIPIGQSPGLSGKYTVMGKIDQVNPKNQTIKMSGASGSYTVKMTKNTEQSSAQQYLWNPGRL